MPKTLVTLSLLLALVSACGDGEPTTPAPAGPYALGDAVSDFSGPGLAGEVSLADLSITPETATAAVLEFAGEGASLDATFEGLKSLQDEDGEYDEDLKTELIAKAGRRFGLMATDEKVEELTTLQALADWISAAQGAPRVLMVWAAGCGTCKRVYNDKVTEALGELGVPMLVLASHPYDTRDLIDERLDGSGYSWKVMLDQDQRINALFGAERTPHMIVLDAKGVIRYSGGVDSAPDLPRGDEELEDHLTNAINAIRAGKAVEVKTSDTIGCPLPKAETQGA